MVKELNACSFELPSLTDRQLHHYCEYLKSGFSRQEKKKKKQIKKDYGLHV